MPAFKAHKTETSDAAWDGPAQKAKARSGESRGYYGRIYAWYDPDGDESVKESYKFVHHFVSGGGDPGAASTVGCSAGIGVLNGGRGGTTIPSGDKRSVYNHLAAHLRDAGKEVPEYKGSVDLIRRDLTASSYIDELRMRFDGPQLFRINSVGSSGDDERTPYDVLEGVAIISINGLLSNSPRWWDETGYDDIKGELAMAVNDPAVNAILLNINSPGGETEGAFELADFLAKCGKKKRMWAVANPIAYSGAYLLASQAEKIYVPPTTGGVGSIGVFSMHTDVSGMLEKVGIDVTILSAGEGKTDGNPYEPLSKRARETLLSEINRLYSAFVSAVARGRDKSEDEIRSLGAYLYRGGQASIAAGLADATGGLGEAWLALSTAQEAEQPSQMASMMSVADSVPPAMLDSLRKDALKATMVTAGVDVQPGGANIQIYTYEQDLSSAPIEGNVATASAAHHPTEVERELELEQKEVPMSTAKETGKADATQATSPPAEPTMTAADLTEIADLCTMVGRPAMAAEFISKKTPLADVRSKLMAMATAQDDGAEINNHPKQEAKPDAGSNGVGGRFLVAACEKMAAQAKAMRGGQ